MGGADRLVMGWPTRAFSEGLASAFWCHRSVHPARPRRRGEPKHRRPTSRSVPFPSPRAVLERRPHGSLAGLPPQITRNCNLGHRRWTEEGEHGPAP